MKVALTNTPPDIADEIASTLIDERLAACINMFPVKSVYRWKGQVEVDDETSLLIKVSADRVEALRARLEELHPYELMEFVVLDIDAASSLQGYIDFVRDGCSPKGDNQET